MALKTHQSQIFISSPELQIPTQTLTLDNPNLTLHTLKLSLFKTLTLDSFFTLNGKTLPDSTQTHQIPNLSTLSLRLRRRGGGGDGGSTCAESRDCYLNMYAERKPDKVDPNEQRLSKWLNCALSNEPLNPPIVVDLLGNVFNKESLVEALLDKKLPKAFSHIKGLKDMVSVNLDSIGESDGESRFQCPVTGLEFNGKYKFFALRTCGHVLSAKALKMVKSSGCIVCRKEFGESDKIVINGSDEEVNALRERMEEEKAKVREKRTNKKVKNGEVELGSGRLSGTKHGIDGDKALAKVEMNGKIGNGGGVIKGSDTPAVKAKRFKAGDAAPANATKEVYASIFISSRKSEFKETYSCRSLPLGRN